MAFKIRNETTNEELYKATKTIKNEYEKNNIF